MRTYVSSRHPFISNLLTYWLWKLSPGKRIAWPPKDGWKGCSTSKLPAPEIEREIRGVTDQTESCPRRWSHSHPGQTETAHARIPGRAGTHAGLSQSCHSWLQWRVAASPFACFPLRTSSWQWHKMREVSLRCTPSPCHENLKTSLFNRYIFNLSIEVKICYREHFSIDLFLIIPFPLTLSSVLMNKKVLVFGSIRTKMLIYLWQKKTDDDFFGTLEHQTLWAHNLEKLNFCKLIIFSYCATELAALTHSQVRAKLQLCCKFLLKGERI